MLSEKPPPPEHASQHIHLPLLTGFKTSPDDGLPLYTDSRVRARVSRSWKRGFFVISSLCLLLVLVRSIPLSGLPFTRSPLLFTGASQAVHTPIAIAYDHGVLITAEHGAVAAENKRCSEIGVKVLQDGGNAVDAAISASLCLGVVNMFSSGIGGGGFMTVRIPPTTPNATSDVFTVDFRETAPGKANKEMFVGHAELAKIGGLSVAVPGELRGLDAAHSLWGNLSWQRLVQPSAELAAEWTVDVELAKRIQLYPDLLLHNKDWSPVFAPEGKLLLENQTIRRTNYSRTLDTIAREGHGAFYRGSIADSIVRKVKETGGILTHADLENYTVKVERALEGTYRDRRVYTPHAPTSGPVLLHMLNLLERFDWTLGPWEPLNVHRIVEAMKFGYAARTRLGDLPYYKGNMTRVTEIPTKEFANRIAVNLTDDCTHEPEYYNPEFDGKPDHGTSHLSVVDKNGMAVALTTSVNLVFGSQVLDPETGVILNDVMDDFSIPGTVNAFGLWPSPYNYPEPGKRPLSSMTPAILEYDNGSFYLAIGAAGGSHIPTATLQTLLNVEWGMNASQAVEYGRVHHQLYPNHVTVESIVPQSVIKGLHDHGHFVNISDVQVTTAVVQTVVSKDGKIYAASDSRKHGIAAGY